MLELRDEFLSKHMRGTAIELRNKQNTALGEFYERLERESNTQLAEGLQRVE